MILLLLAIPIMVNATPLVKFQQWVTSHHQAEHSANNKEVAVDITKPLTKAQLMKLGEAGYQKYCAVCHQADGKGLLPTFPALAGGLVSTGPAKANINIVVNGKSGTVMQAYKHQMDVKTLATIITYVRNAWGNDAMVKKNGYQPLVQPGDVLKVEKQANAK